MDAMKKIVFLTIIVCIGVSAVISVILVDSLATSSIPDVQRGSVLEKQRVSENVSRIDLANGQKLFVVKNDALFSRIAVNESYVFDCRIDFNNKITIIDNATLIQ